MLTLLKQMIGSRDRLCLFKSRHANREKEKNKKQKKSAI